jgi:hypothetical protein
MVHQNPDEIYLQCLENETGSATGVIAIRELGKDSYTAYVYDLTPRDANARETKLFDRGAKEVNYTEMQEFIKNLTLAEGVFFDCEVIEGRFSESLEAALKNHFDRGN